MNKDCGVEFEQMHCDRKIKDRLISRAVLISFSVTLKIQSLQGVHPVEEKVCENDNSLC